MTYKRKRNQNNMKGKIHCGHTDVQLSKELIKILEKLECLLDDTITITSGVRCIDCNRKAMGKEDSAHLKGLAVDIATQDSHMRYLIIKYAIQLGIRRIGINYNKNFIHIDIDTTKPQDVCFGY